ncbi:MAG: hypothetical protein AVDCRST_MAG35-930, partial [uncultured Quadrisphaera sp.]
GRCLRQPRCPRRRPGGGRAALRGAAGALPGGPGRRGAGRAGAGRRRRPDRPGVRG